MDLQHSRPIKRARAPTTDLPLSSTDALPHLDLSYPCSIPASKSNTTRTSSKRAKPSARKKSATSSPGKTKGRDLISELVRVGGAESEDNEEEERSKKRGKSVPRVADEDAQMQDATAPSAKASSRAPALSTTSLQPSRQQSEPTPEPLILQHSILGDKSNLPRAAQIARPPPVTRPNPQASPAQARSTTAVNTIESPRPLARHSSDGGSATRRPLSRVSLASPRIPVFRDAPTSSHALVAAEEGEDSAMIDIAALSSALPSSLPTLPAILGSPFTSQHLVTPHPHFPSTRISNQSNVPAMSAQNELPRPSLHPSGGSAIPFATEMNSSFVLETFEEGSVENLFASLRAHGVVPEPRANAGAMDAFDVADYLDLAAMDADDEDDTILAPARSNSHSGNPTSPSPQAPRTTFSRPVSAGTSLDLPPRLLSPPLASPLPNGPPSDEDDLAYLIRTTSSHLEDEREWAASEAEIGEGFAVGSRIGGGKGARRGVGRGQVLEKGREIVCGDEEEDELRMRW